MSPLENNSAYAVLKEDLAEQIKVNLAGQERELKLMHEVEKLNAENERLIEDLRKIANHETLDGDKYNNYGQAYFGVVEFAAKALRGADEK